VGFEVARGILEGNLVQNIKSLGKVSPHAATLHSNFFLFIRFFMTIRISFDQNGRRFFYTFVGSYIHNKAILLLVLRLFSTHRKNSDLASPGKLAGQFPHFNISRD
jgi:hypothetical protein